MSDFEHHALEFKEIYIPEIAKDVVAFANTDGGIVRIGVRRDGTVIGVADPDDVMLRAASSLKDGIRPDVMPFIKIESVQEEGTTVVEIRVGAGAGKPYYLAGKGLRPNGVYVRRGSASQPLSDAGIRTMIAESTGASYEQCRSMRQDLSFAAMERAFAASGFTLDAAKMQTLHLVEDGLFTNLALLLSDQCEHTIKAAYFQGTDMAVFRDRREFAGSVFDQIEQCYAFIDTLNRTAASFSGLRRTDRRDYPEDAVREALLNCVIHRDYSFSSSTLLRIYDDRMEFVSLGGLVPGLSMDAIFMGVSQSRNPHLAAIFYRLKLIESYGTGIGKIMRAYADTGAKPNIASSEGAFSVTLPNRAASVSKVAKPQRDILNEDSALYGQRGQRGQDSKAQRELVCNHAAREGGVTRAEVEHLLGVRTTRAYQILKSLCDDGMLRQTGKGRSSRFIIA